MDLSLSPETQKLIEERMRRDGYSSPDDLVRAALELLDQQADLDEDTLAAIDHSEAQIERGEYREWSEVSADLRKRFLRQ